MSDEGGVRMQIRQSRRARNGKRSKDSPPNPKWHRGKNEVQQGKKTNSNVEGLRGFKDERKPQNSRPWDRPKLKTPFSDVKEKKRTRI